MPRKEPALNPAAVPPVGQTLGVASRLSHCPLCGGPNPHHTPDTPEASVPPLPEVVRPPTIAPRNRPVVTSPPEATRDAVAAATLPSRGDGYDVLDNPIIGGRFTVCVLCYGDHEALARRCLDSILSTVPAGRLDLRVGANQVSAGTLRYLEGLPLTKLYVHADNALKYPVMREMFWDDSCPLGNYVVWFDDDSYVIDPKWALRLGETIVENHRHRVRLYGMRFFHDLAAYRKPGHDPAAWFRTASWYKGVPFGSARSEAPVPNGSVVYFATGGFFALATEAIRRGDIPDVRLKHNGGDITIGEQVRQAGYHTVMFNRNKALVHSSGYERRGYSEHFPWAGR